MTGQGFDDFDDEEWDSSEQPWHNRTPAVVGASILGLVVIGILVLALSFVARQSSEPQRAPLNYVEPSFSVTATGSATSTTTQTITSTSPPQTTDLEPGLPPPSSSSATSSDERGAEDDEDDESSDQTTRRGPRTNVTRTFNPFP